MYIEKLFVQLSDALKMYPTVDKDKKTFNLVECWRVLRNEDKWKARMVELAEMEKLAAQEKKKSTKVSRPREEEDTTNEEGTEAVGDQTKERKRPEGVKKAKEALKRGGGEALEAFNNMWAKKEAFDKEKEEAKKERFMATLEVDKAALELEKKKAEAALELEKKSGK